MTNIQAVAIHLPFALMTAMVLLFSFAGRSKYKMNANLVFFCAMIFCWQLTNIFYYLSDDPFVIRYLYDLKIPFVAFSIIAFFLFVLQFYKVDYMKTPTKMILLFIIPILTTIFALTSPFHTVLREMLLIVQINPFHEVEQVRGIFFYIHTVYSYGIMLTSALVSIICHRKLPQVYRLPSTFLFIALLVSLVGNMSYIFSPINIPLDVSLFTASITSVFLCIVAVNDSEVNCVMEAKREILHYLEEAVGILDDERNIVMMNRTAKHLLKKAGIFVKDDEELNFDDLMSSIKKMAIDTQDNIGDSGGQDITLQLNDKTVTYLVKEKDIFNKENSKTGSIIIVSDVTENRKFIRELEYTAGMDALTGLQNRRSLETVLKDIVAQDAFPVACLLGDVNGLKEVNDSLGHAQGDLLLRVIAETLERTCPPGGYLFRIGGDEFLVLIPRHNERKAREVIDWCNKRMHSLKGYPFEASVSFGYSIMETANERFSEHVLKADKMMYEVKKEYLNNKKAAKRD